MTSLTRIRNILQLQKTHLQRKYKIKALGVFGSYSRGEQNEKSDIDILVEFDEPIGIEFVDLATELENILGEKVELVSRSGIKTRYLRYVEEDVVYV